MSSVVKNLFVLVLFPLLILKRIYFWYRTDSSNLPGKAFAEFGFMLGRKLLLKGKFSPKLLLNPVSIVRYFEFDYVNRNLHTVAGSRILDVSSPYLFGFYQSTKINSDYYYTNPDLRDLDNVISLSKKIKFKANYFAERIDALNLPFDNYYFDAILSISVIEHIYDEGDSLAMKEIWRVLKQEGKLILTFPVNKVYNAEYRNKDEYNLNVEKKSGKYFFQRIYDEQKIEERLLSSINNYEIISKKVFGVTEKNFYFEYKKRWMKYSYWETVKDPYYISKKFSYFPEIKNLEDIGVLGLTIKKLI
jgi:SAM-dependent methyltransferase